MMIVSTLLFNIVYYVGTFAIGILILPSLLLPEPLYIPFIRQYFRWVAWCERNLLGLDYVVEGAGYLPQDQPYMVAAKHQSAFETLKLPLLFEQPVVILKRELLRIPFWGWYAAKAGNIGINRSKPREALIQMVQGVQNAAEKGHTVVIFPQGTRVAVGESPSQKPYKRGVSEIYQSLNIPVVPLALNSGLFWPRNAFFKRGGVVTLKFLPPIPPGLAHDDFMARLEHSLETESALLVERAREHLGVKRPARFWDFALGFGAILILGYTAAWFFFAHHLEREIAQSWETMNTSDLTLSAPPPRIIGYPGRFHMIWRGQITAKDKTKIALGQFHMRFWPIPGQHLTINVQDLTIDGPMNNQIFGIPHFSADPNNKNLTQEMTIDHIQMVFEIPASLPTTWTKSAVQKLHALGTTYRLHALDIRNASVGDFVLSHLTGSGALSYDENLQPQGTLDLNFSNAENIRDVLANAIPHPMGKSFITGVFDSLMVIDPKDQSRHLPITLRLKDGRIFAGPLKLAYMGMIYWPVDDDSRGAPLAPARTSTSPVTR